MARGDGEGFEDLIDSLRGAGLGIPDGVRNVRELIIAVKAASGQGVGGDLDQEQPLAGDGTDGSQGATYTAGAGANDAAVAMSRTRRRNRPPRNDAEAARVLRAWDQTLGRDRGA
jgi:hypothetical protein